MKKRRRLLKISSWIRNIQRVKVSCQRCSILYRSATCTFNRVVYDFLCLAEKDTAAEDFSFGAYQPSAAVSSRSGSRRSVRFDYRLSLSEQTALRHKLRHNTCDCFRFEDNEQRPKSTPARGSYLEKAIESDTRDWREMARPSSEGGRNDAKSEASSAEPEAVDWLGLSRLGSPDLSGAREGRSGNYDAESDEFVSGFQLSPRQSQRHLSSKSRDVTFSANLTDQSHGRHSSPPRTPPKSIPLKGANLPNNIIISYLCVC